MTTDGPGSGSGWARWGVPVAVAVIAAVATVLAAVLPGLLDRGGNEPPSRPGAGRTTSGPGTAGGPAPTGTAVLVSVDRVVTSLGSTDVDPDDGDGLADLSASEDKLTAISPAQLAPLKPGERPSPAFCAGLPEDAWVGAVGPPVLASGRTLCLRTSAGRWGAVAVAQVEMVEGRLAYARVRATVWG
ncbi:MAG TPA: hypothetical protein VFM55_07095 [Micromonosporaceae bacterium]|nr:hypothetical protein [Micromonosporaceae bacterium]